MKKTIYTYIATSVLALTGCADLDQSSISTIDIPSADRRKHERPME